MEDELQQPSFFDRSAEDRAGGQDGPSLFEQSQQAARDEPRSPEAIAAIDDLEELRALALGCEKCGLQEGRTQVVFGEGPVDARLMMIGEGPGANEDEQGRPFVGRAGKLLNKILNAIDLKRDDVYITNVVLCRPPSNRTPRQGEISTCVPWLRAQVRLVDPALIMTLGSTATQAVVDRSARITRWRGTWREAFERPVMPTFHPAALLRDPRRKPDVWEDFQKVQQRLQEIAEAG